MTVLGFFRMASQRREEERERCYQIVYTAIARAEEPAVIEALKSVAIQIVDPK